MLPMLNVIGLQAVVLAQLAPQYSANMDLSIESMRSQRFGLGVFVFLLIGILVFSSIIYAVLPKKGASEPMRTGEKVMFAAIIMGVVVAIIFGATQMVSGVLF
jgi:hypothetical protein